MPDQLKGMILNMSNCTIIFVDFKHWRSSTRIVYMDKWREPEESTELVECPF